jgi:beta-galactosidase GanA
MRIRYLMLFCLLPLFAQTAPNRRPFLRKQGPAAQLIVDGSPFLVLGGELHNSSSSSLAYMEPIWQRMRDLNLNTVLVGLNWELIEPEEGRFNFSLVDGLIQGARRNNLHLILLWFGSWKNAMSSYVPLWVKKDYKRFPRAQIKAGEKIETLSTLAESNWKADAAAFAALMHHIREVDDKDNTVIMMQVENESGVLGDSRDRCEQAEKAFGSAVPQPLMDFLQKNRNELVQEIRKRWEANGFKSSGKWEEVFGPGVETDEMFMAWNYARYIDNVAAAGKAQYGIPMYVNAWLAGPGRTTGSFPSGGALPYDMDIWLAGAPHIDLLAPDIYSGDFSFWCTRYTDRGNPLFIPETNGQGSGPRNLLFAFGEYNAIGTSPFAVDSIPNPKESELARTYAVVAQIAPLILQNQGKGNMTGFVLSKDKPSIARELGGYELEISLDSIFGSSTDSGSGIIISIGPDAFLGAGSGFRVRFKPKTAGPARAGIGQVDEGTFQNGKWIPGRRLNGDENDQGNYWRFDRAAPKIERCIVYRWE